MMYALDDVSYMEHGGSDALGHGFGTGRGVFYLEKCVVVIEAVVGMWPKAGQDHVGSTAISATWPCLHTHGGTVPSALLRIRAYILPKLLTSLSSSYLPCCEVAAHEMFTSSEGSCIAQRGEQSLSVSFGGLSGAIFDCPHTVI